MTQPYERVGQALAPPWGANAQAGSLAHRESALAYLYLLPSLVLLAALIAYPVGYTVWMSLHDVSLDPGRAAEWVGLRHYFALLRDGEFWSALRTTLMYSSASVVGTTLLGLAAALLLNRPFRGRGLARGLILLPYVAPVISVVYAWQYVFHPVYGYVNYWLVDVVPVLSTPQDWVDSPQYALPMVMLFEVWRYFPFAFLMLLARLQSIPTSLYEAAEVDGAGAWAKFRFVTLPELSFVVGALVILRWIWSFNKFDDIWLLTRSVQTVTVYTYLRGFVTYRIAEAAAASTLLVLFLVGFVAVYGRKVLKW